MSVTAQQSSKQRNKSVSLSKPVAIKHANSVKVVLRPKLKLGAPNDKYEQEADRVAEQVMRIPEPRTTFLSGVSLQANSIASCKRSIGRSCPSYGEGKEQLQAKKIERLATEEVTPAIDTAIHALQGGGKPMSKSERHFFEPRFGTDFSNVRVHNDTRAANAARSVNAHAFTLGHDVVFGPGEYSQDTFAGRKLLAHELIHVVQQGGKNHTLQRMPYDFDTSSAELHERIGKEFSRETGTPYHLGSQYSPGYEAWLEASTPRIRFLPPVEIQINPLERLKRNESSGKTFILINGQEIDGDNMADLISNMSRPFKPTKLKYKASSLNQRLCKFDPEFKIDVGTKLVVATPPGKNGWEARLPPAVLNNPSQCAGKTEITTILRGDPDDKSYQKLIRDSELDHVKSIKSLHERHLVPYYNFVMSAFSTASSDADCTTQLNQQIGKRLEQAVFGFALGDAAEAKRFDAPGSTHHGRLLPVIGRNCNTVTLTSKQTNPQQEGRDPGNVNKIAPRVKKVDSDKLTVNGSDLMSDGNLIHSFSSSANAKSAMGIMVVHNITEINSIGSFHIALSNGVPPILDIPGIRELEFDPVLIQVSIGMPNPNDWVISQVKGDQFFEIMNFGANRDQAYSAVELLRQLKLTHKMSIVPEFEYYRKA